MQFNIGGISTPYHAVVHRRLSKHFITVADGPRGSQQTRNSDTKKMECSSFHVLDFWVMKRCGYCIGITGFDQRLNDHQRGICMHGLQRC